MRQGLSQLSLALVLTAFCFPLFIGLGSTDLANDEAIYSYAAESIVETGRWMSPASSPNADIVFLEKPHLKFWIVAAPIRLGLLPYGEFSLRVWDALFGSIAFVYVFLIGRRMAGSVAGVAAVVVLFAHRPLIFDHGLRSNNMDAALVLAYCGGVYHYLRWTASTATRERTMHIAGVAAWFYLGFMTKFVAALFLPIVLGASAALVREDRRLLLADARRWVIAGLVVTAAILPWFVYQHAVHGATFWRVMFGEHVYTRFTAFADPRHVRPWHFYVTEAYRALDREGSLPWIALGLVILAIDTVRHRRREGLIVFMWLTLPVALISSGSSKLYHYLYPFLPPLALATGVGAAWLSRQAARLTAATWMPVRERPVPQWVLALAAVVAAAAAALALWTAIAGTLRLEAGGRVLFRNGSVYRPMAVALLCGVVLFGLRKAAGVALVLGIAGFTPGPLKAYEQNLRLLTVTRRPLGTLAACVHEVDAARRGRGEAVRGAYAPVSEAMFLHPYFFYLRGTGWLAPPSDDELRTAMFTPGEERPVVIDKAAYSPFLGRTGSHDNLPAVVDLPTVLLLLPGPYSRCAAPPVPSRS